MARRLWIAGGSIETTLELWASTLRDVKGRMRGLFTQKRVAQSVGLFLDGLHRMVAMATSASGHRTAGAPSIKSTTVMLI